jgi:hypothetical protein
MNGDDAVPVSVGTQEHHLIDGRAIARWVATHPFVYYVRAFELESQTPAAAQREPALVVVPQSHLELVLLLVADLHAPRLAPLDCALCF